jgi:hypothetical protein
VLHVAGDLQHSAMDCFAIGYDELFDDQPDHKQDECHAAGIEQFFSAACRPGRAKGQNQGHAEGDNDELLFVEPEHSN